MSYYSHMVSICNGNTNGSYVVVQLEGIAVVLLIQFGRDFLYLCYSKVFWLSFEHVLKNALGNL